MEPKTKRGLSEAAERRIRAVLTLGFLLPFLSWLDAGHYRWWAEGAATAWLSLFMATAVEALVPANIWTRRSIQLLPLLLAAIAASGYRPVWFSIRSLSQASELIYENIWQLHPFIWFALGSWLAYIFALWWMSSRLRTVVILAAALLAMIVGESRSGVQLWEEAAAMLLAGVLLIMVVHMKEVGRRSPFAWSQLARSPAAIALPLVLLMAATALPGMLLPSIQPFWGDSQFTHQESGSGVAPEYDERLPGEGGQGTNASEPNEGSLNLPLRQEMVELDTTPLFQVETAYPSYWRGEVYSFYDGGAWSRSAAEHEQDETAAVSSDQPLANASGFDASQLETVTVRQTFRLLETDRSFPVLFAAYGLNKVESVDGKKGGTDLLGWLSRNSELLWMGGEDEYPRTYTVESQLPVIDASALAKASAPANTAELEEYLQLPGSLPERVRQLALDVGAGAFSHYEIAVRLEEYLRDTYPYSPRQENLPQSGEDMVDRFLFREQSGVDDHYSSAMVILSRINGIPARWVRGYVPGAPEAENVSLLEQLFSRRDETGEGAVYTIRNSDAHSWAELYFEGYGWLPFEANPGFILALPEKPEEQEQQGMPEEEEAAAADKDRAPGRQGMVAAAMGIGTIAAAAAAFRLLRAKRRAERPVRLPLFMGRLEPRQRIIAEYHRLLKLYRRKGVRISRHETAREAVDRLKTTGGVPAGEADVLLALFEKAKYSPQSITPEESSRAVEIVSKIKKAM